MCRGGEVLVTLFDSRADATYEIQFTPDRSDDGELLAELLQRCYIYVDDCTAQQ
jgi:hypothetical protein